MEYSFPVRLDKVIDNVGVGAIVKSLINDQIAVVIDCANSVTICYYKSKLTDQEPTYNPKNFKIERVSEAKEWLVLTEGYDYDLSGYVNYVI